MFDGSTLGYEENVRQTREVVKMCHAVGVSVEAELGAVGGDEGGALYGHADESLFTDPQLARDFVDRTGIDALAVAIGNAHGKYRGEPKLDFPRLDAIRQQAAIPLVLHGGSGISDADFRRAIELGIHKINFYTGMSQAALAAVEARMAHRQPMYDEFAELLLAVEAAISDTVAQQMRIFWQCGAGMMERKGIIAAGNMLVDHVHQIIQWPERGWLAEITHSERSTGGAPLNVLLTLAKMRTGLPLQAVGLIGQDSDGDYIMAMLEQYHVNRQHVQRTTFAPTSMSQVMTDPSGQRTFFPFAGCKQTFWIFRRSISSITP